MTYVEWLKSWQIDTLQSVEPSDAWRAGALAMLQALIDRGFVGDTSTVSAEKARAETVDIWTIDEAELELYMS